MRIRILSCVHLPLIEPFLQLDEMAKCVENYSPVLVNPEIRTNRLELWSSQTNDLEMYTCCLLAKGS